MEQRMEKEKDVRMKLRQEEGNTGAIRSCVIYS